MEHSEFPPNGMLVHGRIVNARQPGLEHGRLAAVRAIVIHQTASSSASATLSAYRSSENGAHFLIAKGGRIYQTASLHARCYHVGRYIKSKCLAIDPTTCNSAAEASFQALRWRERIRAIDRRERAKPYPDRYPVNSDSIGIELMGAYLGEDQFKSVTPLQAQALEWLLGVLYRVLRLASQDVYRHPAVSYQNPGEARSARW